MHRKSSNHPNEQDIDEIRVSNLRILWIINSYPLAPANGPMAAFFARHIARALVNLGADVQILAPNRQGNKQPDPNIPVHWFPWSGERESALAKLNMRSISGWRHALSLYRNGRTAAITAARQFRADVCLAGWALPSGYFANCVHRALGVPYAVWCLGSDIHTWARKPFFRKMTQKVLTGAETRYADGFGLAREVELLAKRPCGFLATSSPLETEMARLPLFDPNRVHFVYVGRWEEVKGLDVLLDAWELVQDTEDGKRAQLHIVGDGSALRERVTSVARSADVNGSIHVAGMLSREDLVGFYLAADCVVIPSRNESIPVVLTEALQAGKPLIVTDVGDMRRIVEEYRLGCAVPSERPNELAESIIRFVRDGWTFDTSARNVAQQVFDAKTSAKKLLADLTVFSPSQPIS